MEASLFGAIVISNDCATGSSFADLPIPGRFLLPLYDEKGNFNSTQEATVIMHFQYLFRQVFDDYWNLVPLFEPLRKAVLMLTPESMVDDARGFLSTIHISEVTNASTATDVFKIDCKGC